MISDLGASIELMIPVQSCATAAQQHIERAIEDLISSLPNPGQLSADERRGIIARYTAILEGNFIYWMTATYLSVRSTEAHSIIEDNLREEVRDNHPGMLRRFAVAAHATSTDADRLAVERNLQDVRAFVARLSTLQIVLMMAFFEGFIARFMPFLAELASRQGSTELEYTDVHGIVDIGHTQGLFRAFAAEMPLAASPQSELFDGVTVLSRLLQSVIGSSAVLQQ
jgi:Iron-containing redox enzyme